MSRWELKIAPNLFCIYLIINEIEVLLIFISCFYSYELLIHIIY